MTSPTLPAELRDRVLMTARRARAAGRPTTTAPEISPTEAFRRAADALDDLLGTLADEVWRRPVLRGLDVQCLVGHLTGVEVDMQRCLSGDPDVASADHVGSTQPWAASQADRDPAQTRAQWRRAADRTILAVLDRDLGAEVAMHRMRLPLGALLVVRAFELWTHDNDIRRVAGLPPTVPGASAVRLMTDLAASLLPHGAVLAGPCQPVDLHLVLTGPGGGTWDVAIGKRTGAGHAPVATGARGSAVPSPVTIVTDAIGFCRLVANRATPADLELQVTGDHARASQVLSAASALALD